jgi:hypothetical protein
MLDARRESPARREGSERFTIGKSFLPRKGTFAPFRVRPALVLPPPTPSPATSLDPPPFAPFVKNRLADPAASRPRFRPLGAFDNIQSSAPRRLIRLFTCPHHSGGAMAEPTSKKTKKAEALVKKYPDTAADRLFREDPYSRLLLLAHYQQTASPAALALRGTSWSGNPHLPLLASPQETRRLITLRVALGRAGCAEFYAASNFNGDLNLEDQDAVLKEIALDHPGLDGVTLASAKQCARQLSNAPSHQREALEKSSMLPALIQAFLTEYLSACLPKIPEDQLPDALANGRRALSDMAGFDVERLDALKEDPELCLALCRLAFGGPTELSLIRQDGHEYVDAANATLARTYSRHFRDHDSFVAHEKKTAPPLDHPLSGVVFPKDSSPVPVFSTLAVAAFALSAPGPVGAKARQALLRLTDTRPGSSWDAMPPAGDVAYFDPAKHERHQARRKSGVPVRGELAKVAMGQWASISSWRTPLKAVAWGATPGLKYASALAREAQAHQDLAPQALARALDELAERPSLKQEIGGAFASRVAAGFSSLPPDPQNDDFFPELASFRDAVDASAGPSFKAGEMIQSDAMGAVALAASKALGFTSDTPLALVGEAKRALADQAGVSPAAWKGLAASPELAKAFEKMMGMVQKKTAPSRLGAIKAAEEIMQLADRDGSAFSSVLKSCAAREEKMTAPEAAGRALSACAMGGVDAQAQTRLLHFLSQNETARLIVAGRLPRLPSDWTERQLRYHQPRSSWAFEPESDQTQALKADIEALVERGPALTRGLSERLERAWAKSKKASPDDDRARNVAYEQLNALVGDVFDCAAAQPTGFWAGLDKKDPWASAMRQHETWAQQERDRQAHANPSLLRKWRAEIGRMAHGRVEANELSVGIDLFNEGKAMSHCVGSYAERCFSGSSRIFSVRIDASRQSTLELGPCSKAGGPPDLASFDPEDPQSRSRVKGWAIRQNRGKHNALNLSAELKEACQTFAKQYGAAFDANTLLIAKRLQEEREEKAKEQAQLKHNAQPAKLDPPAQPQPPSGGSFFFATANFFGASARTRLAHATP